MRWAPRVRGGRLPRLCGNRSVRDRDHVPWCALVQRTPDLGQLVASRGLPRLDPGMPRFGRFVGTLRVGKTLG